MLFSIVIPTRNRPECLPGAVRSALAQTEAGDFEVIVFDNASTERAEEVLAGISSPRLRVVRTEEPLAMRDSWENALSLAAGDYITILGDDDALLPAAVRIGRRIVEQQGVELLRWDRAHYLWPGFVDSNLENKVTVPLGRTLFKVDGHWTLRQMGRMRLSFSVTPMIYNSWVHRKWVLAARKAAGRVFHTASPDVDSGFAFAWLARWFHNLNFPLSICGQSPKSNGAQATKQVRAGQEPAGDLEVASDFHELNRKVSITCDANEIPTFWGAIATSYKTLAAAYNVPTALFSIDPADVAEKVLRSEFPSMSRAACESYLSRVVERLDCGQRHQQRLRHLAAQNMPASTGPQTSQPRRHHLGYDEYRQTLMLDCSILGISDAESLALRLDEWLGMHEGMDCLVQDWHPKRPWQHVRDLAYKLFKARDVNFRNSRFREWV